jgi:hypothetical protein
MPGWLTSGLLGLRKEWLISMFLPHLKNAVFFSPITYYYYSNSNQEAPGDDSQKQTWPGMVAHAYNLSAQGSSSSIFLRQEDS